ncbi:unnamed protein product [Staurois parvus]|uniref:Uncharacterized protein n=1 Tax=Staurois parvus TaxID=386267 RepID=A0ABN9FEW0_9NEOB|nr:unnamed protein product [Staurois parvus]
MDGTVPPTS